MFVAYLNSLAFCLHISFIIFEYFFTKLSDKDEFFIFGQLYINLAMLILKTMVDLLAMISFTNVMNFSFSLNLWKILSCWYATHMIFFCSNYFLTLPNNNGCFFAFLCFINFFFDIQNAELKRLENNNQINTAASISFKCYTCYFKRSYG